MSDTEELGQAESGPIELGSDGALIVTPNVALGNELRCRAHVCKPLAHLDYDIHYCACPIDPLSLATPLQKESSDTHYLLQKYVTCTKSF